MCEDMQLDWQSAPSDDSAVVVGNRGASSGNVLNSFLHFYTERARTSSPDLNIRTLNVDVDEMEIEESEGMIEENERLLNEAEKEKKKIMKKKMTANQKQKELEKFEPDIKMLK